MENPFVTWGRRHGWTRFQVARLAGVSVKTVQFAEAGAQPSVPRRLAAAVAEIDGRAALEQLTFEYKAWRVRSIQELKAEAMG